MSFAGLRDRGFLAETSHSSAKRRIATIRMEIPLKEPLNNNPYSAIVDFRVPAEIDNLLPTSGDIPELGTAPIEIRRFSRRSSDPRASMSQASVARFHAQK